MTSLAKIPATIITGFLGAGKSTLIRHMLQNAGGKRIALIVNEFGDVGMDADLIKGCGIEGCADEDVIELANGCICCTVADDFLPTIEMLLDRPDKPDHIVIETSGLALPKPLVRAFAWPEVKSRVTVDGVVTVVDAPAVAAGTFAHNPEAVAAQRAADESLDHESPLHELFHDQLNCADLVILSKADLVDAATAADVQYHVAEDARPGVSILVTDHGKLDPAVLLGLGAGAEDDLDSRPSHHEHGHHDHDHDHDHDHGHHHHDHDHDAFDSVIAPVPSYASAKAAEQAILPILQRPDVLRVKGFVAVEGKPMRLAVQGVGPRLETYFDEEWPEGRNAGRLAVIGLQHMDKTAIVQILADTTTAAA